MSRPEISIVIPVYNEAENIEALTRQVRDQLDALTSSYEILFIDDGSKDKSYEIICGLHDQFKNVEGISLARNFGHQMALFAGLTNCKGEVVITMDGDLQHPPEFIPQLYQKWKEGFNIVNTKRIDSGSTGLFKKWTSKWYYKLMNYLSDVRIEPAAADFRLMDRKALNAYLQITERDRFNRGLISWMGFNQTTITYHANPRNAGKSKYTLRKMISFGLSGITSFSSRPLRLSFYSGLLFSFLGFLYALFALVQYFLGTNIPGWTSILMTVLIIGGLILINLGIIGEYIARIFHEVKRRPPYLINETTNSAYLETNGEKEV